MCMHTMYMLTFTHIYKNLFKYGHGMDIYPLNGCGRIKCSVVYIGIAIDTWKLLKN